MRLADHGGFSPRPAHRFGLRRGSRQPLPAVLFFDQAGYEQFDQIAGCLRRSGIAAIRAAPGRSGRKERNRRPITRWLRDRLLYDQFVTLDTADALAALESEGFRLLDIHLAEATVASLGLEHPVVEALGGRSLAFAEHPPSQLLDKFEVNARLDAAGVRIPAQCAANELGPAQALRAFGLPLVVKARVGLGGDGVRIAHSLAEVEQAVRDLCRDDLSRGFFQAYVEGKAAGYACVRGADRPLLDVGYRVDGTQWRFGPSARVVLDGDPSLVGAGRRVVEALGCRGFAQIDLIRDAGGEVWPIDANLRPSGNILAFLCLNIDFAEAYVALLRGRSEPFPRSTARRAPDSADVFPFALYEAARRGTRARLAAAMSQFQLICRRGPGWRYRLIVSAKLLTLLLRRLKRFSPPDTVLAGRGTAPTASVE